MTRLKPDAGMRIIEFGITITHKNLDDEIETNRPRHSDRNTCFSITHKNLDDEIETTNI